MGYPQNISATIAPLRVAISISVVVYRIYNWIGLLLSSLGCFQSTINHQIQDLFQGISALDSLNLQYMCACPMQLLLNVHKQLSLNIIGLTT